MRLMPASRRSIQKAIEKLHGTAAGLVIANEGENCPRQYESLCARHVRHGQWQELKKMFKQGQDAFMALRTAPKPVGGGALRRVLGGGVEVSLWRLTALSPMLKLAWGW